MSEEDVERLQVFWAYLGGAGPQAEVLGPDWAAQKHRALAQAAAGAQRAPGSSTRGLDHMFPPGLGKEAHIARATAAGSPFDAKLPVDRDVQFAAATMAALGPWVGAWREQQLRATERLASAVQPLRAALRQRASDKVLHVARAKDPASMAMLTVLL
eukprot:11188564-Lingulodinium_polyedra.AAC.1